MPIPDTWKTAGKVFLGIFLIQVIVGAVVGHQDSGAAAVGELYGNLRLERRGTDLYLAHVCRSTYTHHFDLKQQVLRTNPTVLLAPQGSVLSLKRHKAALLALVGGSSGALTVRSLGRLRRVEGERHLLVVVGALLSGYLLGHWLVYSEETECDARSKMETLSKKEFWQAAMPDFVSLWLWEQGLRDPRFESAERMAPYEEQREIRATAAPILICPFRVASIATELFAKHRRGDKFELPDYEAMFSFASQRERIDVHPEYKTFWACSEVLVGYGERFGFIQDRNGFCDTIIPDALRPPRGVSQDGFGRFRTAAWFRERCVEVETRTTNSSRTP